MRSSRDDVEQLLAQIRARAAAPEVTRLTDQISLLCRAALTPAPDDGWTGLGLTRMEARLMRALTERLDRIVNKGALMDALYFDRPREGQPKIVDVLVCKIRRKLKGTPWFIETLWGEGYRARLAPQTAVAIPAP